MPSSPRRSLRSRFRRLALRGASAAFKAAAVSLEIYGDLLPGWRMAGTAPRRLPENLGSGLLGAEATTWWAISPSLLPRPWWVTAINVAICQGVGHAVGTGVGFTVSNTFDLIDWHPPKETTKRGHQILHSAMGLTTIVVTATSLWRQDEQAALVDQSERRGRRNAIGGLLVGTLGYGAILLLAELSQSGIDRLAKELRRWMPPVLSWPIAAVGFLTLATVASDRVIVRRLLNSVARRARNLNEAVFPGISQPRRPERTGSPHSLEQWGSVGSKGRALLASGPRAADIQRLTPVTQAKEPIRVFIGLIEGRSVEEGAELAIAELERTGAFERRAIVMMSSAGTGWLSPWSLASFEFLTGGDCAMVAMQYSYLPSAVSYITDRESPVTSSELLIRRLRERLAEIPEDRRPKLFVSGESLGGYGIADSFTDPDDLLSRVDGAVFSGVPGFSRMHGELVSNRDGGSPERLPVVDGGRNVRFAAVPHHLDADFSGQAFEHEWESPRIVFAQHASDPVVFWDWKLFFSKPDWLREPGSRGVPAPEAQAVDVYQGIRWAFFVTGWQVGLDQVTSLDPPGGHGHQYHSEMLHYWQAVLGDLAAFELTEGTERQLEAWIRYDAARSKGV